MEIIDSSQKRLLRAQIMLKTSKQLDLFSAPCWQLEGIKWVYLNDEEEKMQQLHSHHV